MTPGQPNDQPIPVARAWGLVGLLFVGYIGVYLCRKNLATAVPVLIQEFGVSKAEIGGIASVGTLAYALGKFTFGPLIDRWGGRIGFLGALSLVAVFTGLSGLAPGLAALTGLYAANRFSGAAGWGSMVKLTSGWFGPRLVAQALAVLCLSYVVGGASAAWLAGRIAEVTHNNWRAIMSLPAAVLVVLLLLAWKWVPRTDPRPAVQPGASGPASTFAWSNVPTLLGTPAFLALCGLSFTATLGREFFNDWAVHFMTNVGHLPLGAASKASMAFDLGGVAGILGVGWGYDRMSGRRLRLVLMVIFGLLAALMAFAGRASLGSVAGAEAFLAGSGLLLYGPYSLLTGALAVDVRGRAYTATVAGLVDTVGYLASAAAGTGFGWLLDHWGYVGAFNVLAVLMVLSAAMALGVSRPARDHGEAGAPA